MRPPRGRASIRAMAPTPAHTRRALVQLAAARPRDAKDPVVRRYRLSRVPPSPAAASAPDRFAHLRRSYD